jgi:hypothetical protein
MNPLRVYIKSLPDEAAVVSFAKRCGTSAGHLRNIGYDLRVPAAELCAAIEMESNRAVRRWQLRPIDWHRIWPELVDAPGAPKLPKSAKRSLPDPAAA